MLKLAHEKVFACERVGGGFSLRLHWANKKRPSNGEKGGCLNFLLHLSGKKTQKSVIIWQNLWFEDANVIYLWFSTVWRWEPNLMLVCSCLYLYKSELVFLVFVKLSNETYQSTVHPHFHSVFKEWPLSSFQGRLGGKSFTLMLDLISLIILVNLIVSFLYNDSCLM